MLKRFVRTLDASELAGVELSKFYGYAYHNSATKQTVLAPIPFNYVIGWVRRIYLSLLIGPRTKRDGVQEQILLDKYQEGYRQGTEDARKLALLEMERAE